MYCYLGTHGGMVTGRLRETGPRDLYTSESMSITYQSGFVLEGRILKWKSEPYDKLSASEIDRVA